MSEASANQSRVFKHNQISLKKRKTESTISCMTRHVYLCQSHKKLSSNLKNMSFISLILSLNFTDIVKKKKERIGICNLTL